MITELTGAGILLLGILIGRFLPGRRRQPKPPEPVKPICGCSHGVHTHDPKSGACQAQVKMYKYSPSAGREVFDKYGPCACVRYSGPQPITEFYAPEISE